mmetsp:Transcript_18102/g.68404  ORF Transcript_18102/g.68404 Transcript_18102/m.68404 type:complete len:578 (+) Transcript_18102:485-2218(+)
MPVSVGGGRCSATLAATASAAPCDATRRHRAMTELQRLAAASRRDREWSAARVSASACRAPVTSTEVAGEGIPGGEPIAVGGAAPASGEAAAERVSSCDEALAAACWCWASEGCSLPWRRVAAEEEAADGAPALDCEPVWESTAPVSDATDTRTGELSRAEGAAPAQWCAGAAGRRSREAEAEAAETARASQWWSLFGGTSTVSDTPSPGRARRVTVRPAGTTTHSVAAWTMAATAAATDVREAASSGVGSSAARTAPHTSLSALIDRKAGAEASDWSPPCRTDRATATAASPATIASSIEPASMRCQGVRSRGLASGPRRAASPRPERLVAALPPRRSCPRCGRWLWRSCWRRSWSRLRTAAALPASSTPRARAIVSPMAATECGEKAATWSSMWSGTAEGLGARTASAGGAPRLIESSLSSQKLPVPSSADPRSSVPIPEKEPGAGAGEGAPPITGTPPRPRVEADAARSRSARRGSLDSLARERMPLRAAASSKGARTKISGVAWVIALPMLVPPRIDPPPMTDAPPSADATDAAPTPRAKRRALASTWPAACAEPRPTTPDVATDEALLPVRE